MGCAQSCASPTRAAPGGSVTAGVASVQESPPQRAPNERGTLARSLFGGRPIQVCGATDGATVLRAGRSRVRVEYAALTRGKIGKDQDRFLVVPHGGAGLTCGICDGHSIHSAASGQRHAEAAARHLAIDLWRRVHDKLSAPPAGDAVDNPDLPMPPAASLADAATASFLAHQHSCDAQYHANVASPLLVEKQRLEEDLGEELPLELPQDGGTTATVLVVHPTGILAAWVGDSRAIMAVANDNGGMTVTPLTNDHNANDALECERLRSAGGKTGLDEMASHIFVPDAEGGLKVHLAQRSCSLGVRLART